MLTINVQVFNDDKLVYQQSSQVVPSQTNRVEFGENFIRFGDINMYGFEVKPNAEYKEDTL